MATVYTDEMIEIIRNEYPDAINSPLANRLGITEVALLIAPLFLYLLLASVVNL